MSKKMPDIDPYPADYDAVGGELGWSTPDKETMLMVIAVKMYKAGNDEAAVMREARKLVKKSHEELVVEYRKWFYGE